MECSLNAEAMHFWLSLQPEIYRGIPFVSPRIISDIISNELDLDDTKRDKAIALLVNIGKHLVFNVFYSDIWPLISNCDNIVKVQDSLDRQRFTMQLGESFTNAWFDAFGTESNTDLSEDDLTAFLMFHLQMAEDKISELVSIVFDDLSLSISVEINHVTLLNQLILHIPDFMSINDSDVDNNNPTKNMIIPFPETFSPPTTPLRRIIDDSSKNHEFSFLGSPIVSPTNEGPLSPPRSSSRRLSVSRNRHSFTGESEEFYHREIDLQKRMIDVERQRKAEALAEVSTLEDQRISLKKEIEILANKNAIECNQKIAIKEDLISKLNEKESQYQILLIEQKATQQKLQKLASSSEQLENQMLLFNSMRTNMEKHLTEIELENEKLRIKDQKAQCMEQLQQEYTQKMNVKLFALERENENLKNIVELKSRQPQLDIVPKDFIQDTSMSISVQLEEETSRTLIDLNDRLTFLSSEFSRRLDALEFAIKSQSSLSGALDHDSLDFRCSQLEECFKSYLSSQKEKSSVPYLFIALYLVFRLFLAPFFIARFFCSFVYSMWSFGLFWTPRLLHLTISLSYYATCAILLHFQSTVLFRIEQKLNRLLRVQQYKKMC